LITTVNGEEIDPRSNKSIVYACGDGIISIAYTGIAFLGSIPTDQWLVEQITQRRFDRDRKPAAMGLGQDWQSAEDLGQTILRIRAALDNATNCIPSHWKDAWRRETFDLLAAGWRWNKRNRVRPIIVTVSKASGEEGLSVGYHRRFWHFRESRGSPFVLYSAPITNYSRRDMEQFHPRITNRNWEESEGLMAEEIRRVAADNPQVGKHVLTVTLSPSRDAQGVISDHPAAAILQPIRSSFVPNLKAEVHLVPWLVGKGIIQPPALLSHTQRVQLGRYSLTLLAPNKPGPMFFGSLQRPKLR
jgi:hypothetical protein